MANSLIKSLITPLLLCSVALLIVAATAQSDTTYFTYDFDNYDSQPTDLTYQGDAHFPSDSTYLRLTKTNSSGFPEKNSTGRILHSNPVKFWESGAQADFETTLKFIIHPNQGDASPGDGLVFFIAPVGSTPKSAGGLFGIFDDFAWGEPKVFAVEFDIYYNPEVDPVYRHVGIDIETPVSVIDTDVGDALLGQEVTVTIDYKQSSKMIRVQGNAGSKRFAVSLEYDLRWILDEQVQVGISAATGSKVAVYDVISWYFSSTLVYNVESSKDDGHIRQFE